MDKMQSKKRTILPRGTRFPEWDFVDCEAVEAPVGFGGLRPGVGWNSPTTRSGEISVDGQWWKYQGADNAVTDVAIEYAIRHYVVAYNDQFETRMVDGRRVHITINTDEDYTFGIGVSPTCEIKTMGLGQRHGIHAYIGNGGRRLYYRPSMTDEKNEVVVTDQMAAAILAGSHLVVDGCSIVVQQWDG